MTTVPNSAPAGSDDSSDPDADALQDLFANGGEKADPTPSDTESAPAEKPPSETITDDDLLASIMAPEEGEEAAAKPDVTPAADAKPPSTDEKPAATAAADAPPAAVEPTEQEKADAEALAGARTAKQRDSMQRLLDTRNTATKERDTAVKERDEYKPLAENYRHIDSLAKQAGVGYEDLKIILETEKLLESKTDAEVAEYYLGLARDLDPEIVTRHAPKPPAPVVLDEKLRDAVDIGIMSQAEAESIVRAREEKAKPPAPAPVQQQRPIAQRPAPQNDQAARQKAVTDAGFAEIAKAAQGYKAAHPADYDDIAKAIAPKLKPFLGVMNPAAWKQQYCLLVDHEVASRKARVPVAPVRTVSAGAPPPPRRQSADEVTSADDDVEALINGRL
jgi:hypothetical protein